MALVNRVLCSEHIAGESRAYFLDLMESEEDGLSLVINESRQTAHGGYEYKRIVVRQEEIVRFYDALGKILRLVPVLCS